MTVNKTPEIKELQKLLKRCSKGNRNAQEHLYRIYYGYAMSIALRYAKSRAQAEEICNDSFFKIFTKHKQYPEVQGFKPWCRTIIINTAIDSYRANIKNNQLILLDEFKDVQQTELHINTIDAEEIIELLQSLTPMYRMVFNLYVMEGYSHDEIADKLHITSSTSRSNLTRAKQKLRELINNYYEQAR